MAPDARRQMLYRLTRRSGIRLLFKSASELINLALAPVPREGHAAKKKYAGLRACGSARHAASAFFTKAPLSENARPIRARLAINARLCQRALGVLSVGVYNGQRTRLPVRG